MARAATNDPLEKFRFLIDISYGGNIETGFTRLGFHDVQMPKRTTNKIMYREGYHSDISSVSAGLSTMEDIVLSRGVLGSESGVGDFYKWISTVHTPSTGITNPTGTGNAADDKSSSAAYRATVTISMLDRTGTTVRQWKVYQAWPTHFVPGSDLNAGEDGEKSMESLTLAYEDFQEITVV